MGPTATLGHGYARVGEKKMRPVREACWKMGLTQLVLATAAGSIQKGRGTYTLSVRLLKIGAHLIHGLGRASSALEETGMGAAVVDLIAGIPPQLPDVLITAIHAGSDILGLSRVASPVRRHASLEAVSASRGLELVLANTRHPIALSALLRFMRVLVLSSSSAARAFVATNESVTSICLEILARSRHPMLLTGVVGLLTSLAVVSGDEREAMLRANVPSMLDAVWSKLDNHGALLHDIATAGNPEARIRALSAAASVLQHAWRGFAARRSWTLLRSWIVRLQRRTRALSAKRASAAESARSQQWEAVAQRHAAREAKLQAVEGDLAFVQGLPANSVSKWRALKSSVKVAAAFKLSSSSSSPSGQKENSIPGARLDEDQEEEEAVESRFPVRNDVDPASVGLSSVKPMTAQRLRAMHEAIRSKLATFKTTRDAPVSSKELAELRIRLEDKMAAQSKRATVLRAGQRRRAGLVAALHEADAQLSSELTSEGMATCAGGAGQGGVSASVRAAHERDLAAVETDAWWEVYGGRVGVSVVDHE